MGGAIHFRSRRRAAHRRDDLLYRDGSAEEWCGARVCADADPGRRRYRHGRRIDGSGTIRAARPDHPRSHDPDRLDASSLRRGRKGGSWRRRRRSQRRGDRRGLRRPARCRIRYGGARQGERQHHLRRDVRRARSDGKPAVQARRVRSRDPRQRNRGRLEPASLHRRPGADARQARGAGSAQSREALRRDAQFGWPFRTRSSDGAHPIGFPRAGAAAAVRRRAPAGRLSRYRLCPRVSRPNRPATGRR